jgi:tetratricopeptide (TPR) repeat protein
MDDDAQLISASAAYAQGAFTRAAAIFQTLIQKHPDVAELYINLGAALRATGDTAGAEAAYRDATTRAPKNALGWFNLGNLLRDTGRGDEALRAYRKADALQPATPEILNNLGVQLYDCGAVADALKHYDAALAIRPDFTDAIANRGNALQRIARMAEAEAAINTALDAMPDNPVYRLNKASFLAANGHHTAALDWADRAIAADPSYIEARLKRAGLLIQQGDLKAGFSAYEDRWRIPGWHALPSKIEAPVWQGEDLHGKKLLVWNEQGFGDALMYARFLTKLQQMGAVITLMCEKALMRLMQQSFDGIRVVDLSAPPPATDYHISIMSLPFRLGITLDTVPTDAPYLRADDDEITNWKAAIAARSDGKPCVGIIWAGNPGQAHDYARSMPPDVLASLLDNQDIAFFNLLVGPRGNTWRDARLIDVRDQLTDFAATAALMQALDLIVSVDSAPAHLAGGLGVALKILLSFDPDSRYLLGRTDSPWYPSATLIRQKTPGNWAECVLDVQQTLAKLTSA